MARAKIPYDEMSIYVTARYQLPVYRSAYPTRSGRSQYGSRDTPVRIYDRSTGNYTPIGWAFDVFYEILERIDPITLEPRYGRRIEKIIVRDSDLNVD